jgi:protein-tyrosine-phosphatase
MGPSPRPRSKVVFVCLHGAAKSIVAAELFRRYAAERDFPVDILARGLEPDPELSPAAVAGLAAEGISVGTGRPTPLTEEDLAGASRVVAFGCAVSGVVPPTIPVEQWTVPAVSDGYGSARAAIGANLAGLLEAVGGTRTAPHHTAGRDPG